MGKFAKPETQAGSVIKALLRSKSIKSFGTANAYRSQLVHVAAFMKEEQLGTLRDITPELAVGYLEQRSEDVGEKSLDQSRQAIQCMLRHLTNKLKPTEALKVVKSQHAQILKSRAYTAQQTSMIAASQQDKNALATQIAYASGLRAHELHTLLPRSEREPSNRPSATTKFIGREGEKYTVVGKGGLVREVLIPKSLAERLEARRLHEPQRVTDRNIHYQQNYNIGGGNAFSGSFSKAANRSIGWSEGAHGLRHSYAQERLGEVQKQGHSYEVALLTVSQEMGHFRPEITEVYLR